MNKSLKRFTTICLLVCFFIVSINFAVSAKTTQGNSSLSSGAAEVCSIFHINDPIRAWFSGIIFVIFLMVFVFYQDAFLRSHGLKSVYYDSIEKKLKKHNDPKAKTPYSLSLSQSAFWNFIIFGSYLVIYAITGKYNNVLSPSAVILLGINNGTAIVNIFIDGQKGEEYRKGTRRTSENFFSDILSDFNGINFHRLQTLMWTVALGSMFIIEVSQDCTMPTFDPSLLTLQGVSAAAFLGLKSQENNQNKQPILEENRPNLEAENKDSIPEDKSNLVSENKNSIPEDKPNLVSDNQDSILEDKPNLEADNQDSIK